METKVFMWPEGGHASALQIAVLKELEGRGPFCTLVMAVVVVKDVLVIVAYSLNMKAIEAVRRVLCLACRRLGKLLPVLQR
jgi:hypothetical protein